MVIMTSSETKLSKFLTENSLPCYANVTMDCTNSKERDKEKEPNLLTVLTPGNIVKKTERIYLIKTFDADCIFARSYSTNFENLLINQRSSFAQSDMEDLSVTSDYMTLTQNRRDMISEEVAIPFGYQGLFEWFCVNSQKAGGILDHETDIITLASRFQKPSCYYVASELNVYEITNEKTSSVLYKYLTSLNIKQKNEKPTPQYNRKWTKLPVGTIVQAVRVSDFDCFNDTNPYISLCQAAFCCQKSKNKSEMVIEFRVVENFDGLLRGEVEDKKLERRCSVSEFYPHHNSLGDKSKKTAHKSFYIPVDVDNPNKSINLIPIAPPKKNVIFKNSLQTIKNFEDINLAEHPNLEVKIFADNLFPDLQDITTFSKTHQTLITEFCKMNLRLEIGKFSSIFEAYENKKQCKILVGYNIDQQQLFFTAISKVCPTSEFRPFNESDKLNPTNKLDFIHMLSSQKATQFNFELNKMETFSDPDLHIKPENSDIFKTNLLKKPTISNFADFVTCDFKKGSISQRSIKSNRNRFRTEKTASKLFQQPYETAEKPAAKSSSLKLSPIRLKKCHSLNQMNFVDTPIMLSQDIITQVNERMPHLKLDNNEYRECKFVEELKSMELISSNIFNVQSKMKHSSLRRTRSRSLPSILFVSESVSSCCKKNIL